MTATTATRPQPAGRQLSGVDDASVVATTAFRKTQVLCGQTAALREIGLVSGEPGLGKSFAVAEFARRSDLDTVWLQLPPRPTPKEITVRLLDQLVGAGDGRDVLYDLTEELVGALKSPRLVVLDEAQNLNAVGLNQVRYLHDRPETDFALLLVGGAGCEDTIRRDPQLDSRVARRVRFAALAGDELTATLRAFHPLLAASDGALLAELDDRYARGVFRRWARIVQIAAPLAREAGTPDRLTLRVANAALAAIT